VPEDAAVELHVLGVAADVRDQEQRTPGLHAGDANRAEWTFEKLTLKSQSLEGVLQPVERARRIREGDVAMATAVSGRRFATAAALRGAAADLGSRPGVTSASSSN
jgi:hypothetical protein